MSELIAEVNPSVSTDGRSLTIAFSFASSTLPSDRTTWTTIGRASGIAAIASATAVSNSVVHDCPRLRPSANITIIVSPAAPTIHSVSVFICLVSGVSSFAVAESMCAIFPTCVSLPVPVTTITPLPCVTGVCMNAMFDCSPGPISPPDSVAASLAAGTLSPVKADSSICSALEDTIRPSAGTSSPAAISTTSPATSCSAAISASTPSRRTRAVAFIIDWSAFIALSALPSWRSPTTALKSVITNSTIAVLHSLISQRDDRRPDQDELHVARVLGEETADRRRRLLHRERVRAVAPEPLRGLISRKTRVQDDPELAHDVRRVERIPALACRR